jgi:hypothetical protein
MVRVLGIVVASAYSVLIVWLYAAQPRTVAEITGGLTSQVGASRVDDQAFADGLAFFRRDGFAEVPIKGKHFFRAGRANQWRDVLTRAQVERIVARHREQMARFRYVPAGY